MEVECLITGPKATTISRLKSAGPEVFFVNYTEKPNNKEQFVFDEINTNIGDY